MKTKQNKNQGVGSGRPVSQPALQEANYKGNSASLPHTRNTATGQRQRLPNRARPGGVPTAINDVWNWKNRARVSVHLWNPPRQSSNPRPGRT